jgi:hypothetical protein
MKGACLAGEGCSFSHDPSALAGNLNNGNGSNLNVPGSPGSNSSPASRPQRNSSESFPGLQSPTSDHWPSPSQMKHQRPAAVQANSQHRIGSPSSGSHMRNKNGGFHSSNRLSHSNSRPNSRQQTRDLSFSSLSVDDPEAFPTLSSINTKDQRKKGNNKQNHKENMSGGLSSARLASSPTPSSRRPASRAKDHRPNTMTPEKAAAALAIPEPKRVPWFDPEPRGHEQYIRYRMDAIYYFNDRVGMIQTYVSTISFRSLTWPCPQIE